MPRKRTAETAELDLPLEPVAAVPAEEQAILSRVRNMWEFASLMQYIFLFGHVVKIDEDLDIEDLEAECVKTEASPRLASIGLQLLKYVSSHRGLTPQIFDEYARRQYLAKAPQRNPFGDDEEPIPFNELDIYTRIRILQQLSTWTLGNADRIRGLMPEDEDHLAWRMEPLGWDKEDCSYYVLDDNRLYRRSDEPLPPPTPVQKPRAKPKTKAKAKARPPPSRGTRTSKRRKVDASEDEEPEPEEKDNADVDDTAVDDTVMTNAGENKASVDGEEEGYGFTGKTWELIAITLDEYQDFMATIFRSRDPNEKLLRARLEEDVIPIIEKRAEAIRQKHLKKLRELENVQKLATAKRSSRLAGKAEKEAQEREEREAEEKKQADLRMAHEEQARQKRIEEGHESRRLTREQRVREREAKRILHEEELARLEDDPERAVSQGVEGDAAADAKRISERQRLTQKEQHKKELEKLEEEDGQWYFDCSVCGVHGENLDDGSHSVACDKCNVWQHSTCNGFTPKQAEKEDFSFICSTCRRKEEDAKKPKIPPLKLVNRSSGSPETSKSRPATANGQPGNGLSTYINKQLDAKNPANDPRQSPGPFNQITNGPSLSPHGQAQGPPGYRYPPVGNFAPHPAPPQQAWQGNQLPPPTRRPSGYGSSPPPVQNGYASTQPQPHQQHQQHQQQHHNAHQGAVSSSGGHPVYQPQQQYAPTQNGYGHHPPSGMHPMPPQQHYYAPQSQSQPPHQQHHAQQLPHAQYAPPHHHSQPRERQGSGQLLNGFQSPVKAAPKPASSSPPTQRAQPHQSPRDYAQAGAHSQHQAPHLQQSPKTVLPPPANMYQQKPSQSPVKSSPPPAAYRPRPSPNTAHTPQNLPPLSANGHHQTQTPQMRPGSRDSQNHASNVAADGMSGPWPDGSKAIPQKHDQSPAPPSSAHVLGERKIFPPATPLNPSPSQQAAGVIPVKKMQEMSPAVLNGPVNTTLQEQPPLPKNQTLEPPGAPVPPPAELPSEAQMKE